MIRRLRTRSDHLSALLKLEMLSANLAIGTASAFVLVMAAASLGVDRDTPAGPPQGGWHLRGSLSTIDIREKGAVGASGVQARGSRATKLARL